VAFQILGSTDSGDEQQLGHVGVSGLEVSQDGIVHNPSVCISDHDSPVARPCLGKYVLYLHLLPVFVCICIQTFVFATPCLIFIIMCHLM